MNPSSKFSPLYLIHGEERFLMEAFHRRFTTTLLNASTQEFNFTPFRGNEVKASEILSVAETLPVFSEKRLVWIWDAELIESGETERFLDYVDNPSPTTVLVFSATKPDFRKKLFATLKSRGRVLSCAPIPERDIPGWITEQAKERGFSLSQEARLYLKESLGNNLHRIVNELDKIALAHGGKSPITLGDVQEVVVGSKSYSVFDWLHMLGEKNPSVSLQRLYGLLSNGEHPLFLLTMVIRQLRQLAVAKEHMLQGGAPTDLPRMLRFPPSVLHSFLQQVKKWTEKQLREGLALCLEVDIQLKGGAIPGPLLMEGLVLDLCEGRADHTPKVLLGNR